MDKNAIKKYAVWARRELITRVSQRAALYEITEEGYGDPNATSVLGRVLSTEEKKQRIALIGQIKGKGYEQVMEEIAYTWFNRFSALRFMEVNGYLPTRIRVFTDDENNFIPQILTEAINMELDGLDMQKVYDLKDTNDDDALFKYLIITQCNALSGILPGMFQKISDYTELLFPDNLLREGSVVEQMITLIPEEDWTDQVQIIGWLYQYYNTEPKDQVFANLKKNIKISKENIPAATQLFTPDWIVRYMVENSLGRLWLEGHPNDELKEKWKYYLDEAEQEPEVQAQLAEMRKEYAALKPEDILAIDPCQGSGHILAYMFDILVQIYESYGYSAREATASIVKHNIWGLDIDERATQLAYFSVMMKARQYDRRFFKRGIQPHVYVIQESNNLDQHCMDYFIDGRNELKLAMDSLVKDLYDAKEYGSILNVSQVDFDILYARFEEIRNESSISIYSYHTLDTLLPFVQVAEMMAKRYTVVCTNPPYMGSSGMSEKLLNFAKNNYSNGKDDLFSCFIEKILPWLKKNGFCGLMTSYTWMFLTGSVNLRNFVLSNSTIQSLIQPEYHAFFQDANVPICTFILRACDIDYRGSYIRLNDFYGADIQRTKALEAINNPSCGWMYHINRDMFKKIPGKPFAYWIPAKTIDLFVEKPLLSTVADMKQGLITGDNNRFLRFWYECNQGTITTSASDKKKWFFYHKGGEFRKWYGNISLVVNWNNNGEEIINFRDKNGKQRSRPQNIQYYFRQGFTWTALTVADFNVRYMPANAIFDAKGSSGFSKNEEYLFYIMALCNSKVAMEFLSFLAPTMDYSAGSIGKIPIILDSSKVLEITNVVKECIEISKTDWDFFETSWDFKQHPLMPAEKEKYRLTDTFSIWQERCDQSFQGLKNREEMINRIFIDVYGLQRELKPEVQEKDVTIRKADLQRDIRSFLSYAVGCMFGRYSPYKNGLIYAGGDWDKVYGGFPIDRIELDDHIIHGTGFHQYGAPITNKSVVYLKEPEQMRDANIFWGVDKDGIIPICDDEYFEDDIVGYFVEFIEVVYGKDTLEENLQFIADALGGKGSSREIIRNYFLNDFYKDHCKVYQKRPIYWLFDSGKKNGFKCLVYMHRYQPDTIARIRTDYVHEQQSRYRTAIADLENRTANVTTGERLKLSKKLKKVQAQAEELRAYEEKIHHLADQMIPIDLDDGVKVNYAKFKDVLAKIK